MAEIRAASEELGSLKKFDPDCMLSQPNGSCQSHRGLGQSESVAVSLREEFLVSAVQIAFSDYPDCDECLTKLEIVGKLKFVLLV